MLDVLAELEVVPASRSAERLRQFYLTHRNIVATFYSTPTQGFPLNNVTYALRNRGVDLGDRPGITPFGERQDLHAKLGIGTTQEGRREGYVTTLNFSATALAGFPPPVKQQRLLAGRRFSYERTVLIRDPVQLRYLEQSVRRLAYGQEHFTSGPFFFGSNAVAELVSALDRAGPNTPVTVTSPTLTDPVIVSALRRAAHRGAQVVVYTGHPKSAWSDLILPSDNLRKLASSGVQVYTPSPDDPLLLHAKQVVVGETAYIGSHNLSERARLGRSVDVMYKMPAGNLHNIIRQELSGLELQPYQASPASSREKRLVDLGLESLFVRPPTRPEAEFSLVQLPTDLGGLERYLRDQPLQFTPYSDTWIAAVGTEPPLPLVFIDKALSTPSLGERLNRLVGFEVYRRYGGVVGNLAGLAGRWIDEIVSPSPEPRRGGWVAYQRQQDKEREPGPVETLFRAVVWAGQSISTAIAAYIGLQLPFARLASSLLDATAQFALGFEHAEVVNRDSFSYQVRHFFRILFFGEDWARRFDYITNTNSPAEYRKRIRELSQLTAKQRDATTKFLDSMGELPPRSRATGLDQVPPVPFHESGLIGVIQARRRFDRAVFDRFLPILLAMNPYEPGSKAYQDYLKALANLRDAVGPEPKWLSDPNYAKERNVWRTKNPHFEIRLHLDHVKGQIRITGLGEQYSRGIARAADELASHLPADITRWVPALRRGRPAFDPKTMPTLRSLFSFEEAYDVVSDLYTTTYQALTTRGYLERLSEAWSASRDLRQALKTAGPKSAAFAEAAERLSKLAQQLPTLRSTPHVLTRIPAADTRIAGVPTRYAMSVVGALGLGLVLDRVLDVLVLSEQGPDLPTQLAAAATLGDLRSVDFTPRTAPLATLALGAGAAVAAGFFFPQYVQLTEAPNVGVLRFNTRAAAIAGLLVPLLARGAAFVATKVFEVVPRAVYFLRRLADPSLPAQGEPVQPEPMGAILSARLARLVAENPQADPVLRSLLVRLGRDLVQQEPSRSLSVTTAAQQTTTPIMQLPFVVRLQGQQAMLSFGLQGPPMLGFGFSPFLPVALALPSSRAWWNQPLSRRELYDRDLPPERRQSWLRSLEYFLEFRWGDAFRFLLDPEALFGPPDEEGWRDLNLFQYYWREGLVSLGHYASAFIPLRYLRYTPGSAFEEGAKFAGTVTLLTLAAALLGRRKQLPRLLQSVRNAAIGLMTLPFEGGGFFYRGVRTVLDPFLSRLRAEQFLKPAPAPQPLNLKAPLSLGLLSAGLLLGWQMSNPDRPAWLRLVGSALLFGSLYQMTKRTVFERDLEKNLVYASKPLVDKAFAAVGRLGSLAKGLPWKRVAYATALLSVGMKLTDPDTGLWAGDPYLDPATRIQGAVGVAALLGTAFSLAGVMDSRNLPRARYVRRLLQQLGVPAKQRRAVAAVVGAGWRRPVLETLPDPDFDNRFIHVQRQVNYVLANRIARAATAYTAVVLASKALAHTVDLDFLYNIPIFGPAIRVLAGVEHRRDLERLILSPPGVKRSREPGGLVGFVQDVAHQISPLRLGEFLGLYQDTPDPFLSLGNLGLSFRIKGVQPVRTKGYIQYASPISDLSFSTYDLVTAGLDREELRRRLAAAAYKAQTPEGVWRQLAFGQVRRKAMDFSTWRLSVQTSPGIARELALRRAKAKTLSWKTHSEIALTLRQEGLLAGAIQDEIVARPRSYDPLAFLEHAEIAILARDNRKGGLSLLDTYVPNLSSVDDVRQYNEEDRQALTKPTSFHPFAYFTNFGQRISRVPVIGQILSLAEFLVRSSITAAVGGAALVALAHFDAFLESYQASRSPLARALKDNKRGLFRSSIVFIAEGEEIIALDLRSNRVVDVDLPEEFRRLDIEVRSSTLTKEWAKRLNLSYKSLDLGLRSWFAKDVFGRHGLDLEKIETKKRSLDEFAPHFRSRRQHIQQQLDELLNIRVFRSIVSLKEGVEVEKIPNLFNLIYAQQGLKPDEWKHHIHSLSGKMLDELEQIALDVIKEAPNATKSELADLIAQRLEKTAAFRNFRNALEFPVYPARTRRSFEAKRGISFRQALEAATQRPDDEVLRRGLEEFDELLAKGDLEQRAVLAEMRRRLLSPQQILNRTLGLSVSLYTTMTYEVPLLYQAVEALAFLAAADRRRQLAGRALAEAIVHGGFSAGISVLTGAAISALTTLSLPAWASIAIGSLVVGGLAVAGNAIYKASAPVRRLLRPLARAFDRSLDAIGQVFANPGESLARVLDPFFLGGPVRLLSGAVDFVTRPVRRLAGRAALSLLRPIGTYVADLRYDLEQEGGVKYLLVEPFLPKTLFQPNYQPGRKTWYGREPWDYGDARGAERQQFVEALARASYLDVDLSFLHPELLGQPTGFRQEVQWQRRFSTAGAVGGRVQDAFNLRSNPEFLPSVLLLEALRSRQLAYETHILGGRWNRAIEQAEARRRMGQRFGIPLLFLSAVVAYGLNKAWEWGWNFYRNLQDSPTPSPPQAGETRLRAPIGNVSTPGGPARPSPVLEQFYSELGFSVPVVVKGKDGAFYNVEARRIEIGEAIESAVASYSRLDRPARTRIDFLLAHEAAHHYDLLDGGAPLQSKIDAGLRKVFDALPEQERRILADLTERSVLAYAAEQGIDVRLHDWEARLTQAQRVQIHSVRAAELSANLAAAEVVRARGGRLEDLVSERLSLGAIDQEQTLTDRLSQVRTEHTNKGMGRVGKPSSAGAGPDSVSDVVSKTLRRGFETQEWLPLGSIDEARADVLSGRLASTVSVGRLRRYTDEIPGAVSGFVRKLRSFFDPVELAPPPQRPKAFSIEHRLLVEKKFARWKSGVRRILPEKISNRPLQEDFVGALISVKLPSEFTDEVLFSGNFRPSYYKKNDLDSKILFDSALHLLHYRRARNLPLHILITLGEVSGEFEELEAFRKDYSRFKRGRFGRRLEAHKDLFTRVARSQLPFMNLLTFFDAIGIGVENVVWKLRRVYENIDARVRRLGFSGGLADFLNPTFTFLDTFFTVQDLNTYKQAVLTGGSYEALLQARNNMMSNLYITTIGELTGSATPGVVWGIVAAGLTAFFTKNQMDVFGIQLFGPKGLFKREGYLPIYERMAAEDQALIQRGIAPIAPIQSASTLVKLHADAPYVRGALYSAFEPVRYGLSWLSDAARNLLGHIFDPLVQFGLWAASGLAYALSGLTAAMAFVGARLAAFATSLSTRVANLAVNAFVRQPLVGLGMVGLGLSGLSYLAAAKLGGYQRLPDGSVVDETGRPVKGTQRLLFEVSRASWALSVGSFSLIASQLLASKFGWANAIRTSYGLTAAYAAFKQDGNPINAFLLGYSASMALQHSPSPLAFARNSALAVLPGLAAIAFTNDLRRGSNALVSGGALATALYLSAFSPRSLYRLPLGRAWLGGLAGGAFAKALGREEDTYLAFIIGTGATLVAPSLLRRPSRLAGLGVFLGLSAYDYERKQLTTDKLIANAALGTGVLLATEPRLISEARQRAGRALVSASSWLGGVGRKLGSVFSRLTALTVSRFYALSQAFQRYVVAPVTQQFVPAIQRFGTKLGKFIYEGVRGRLGFAARLGGTLALAYLAQRDLLEGRTADFVVSASLAGTLASLHSVQSLHRLLGTSYGRAWLATLAAGVVHQQTDSDATLGERLGVMLGYGGVSLAADLTLSYVQSQRFARLFSKVRQAAVTGLRALSTFGSGLLAGARSSLLALSAFVSKGVEALSTLGHRAFSELAGLTFKAYRGVGWLTAKIGSGLGWLTAKIGSGLGWLTSKIGSGLGWLTSKIGSGLGWLISGIGSGLGWLISGIGSGLGWLISGIGSGLGWLTSKIGSGLSWVASKIGSGLGWLVSRIGSGLGWTVSKIGSGLGWLTSKSLSALSWLASRGFSALGELASAGFSKLGQLGLSLLQGAGKLVSKVSQLLPHTYTGLRFAGVLAASYLAQQDFLTGRTSDFVVTASLAGTLAALDSPQRLLSFLSNRYGRAWTAALLAGLYDRNQDPDAALNKRLGVMALAASAVLGTEELLRGVPALSKLAFAGISRLGRLSLSLLQEGGNLLAKTLRLFRYTYTGLRYIGLSTASYLVWEDLFAGRTSDFVVTASLTGTLAALDSPQRLLSFLSRRYGRAWTAALLAGLYDRNQDPDAPLNKRLGVMALAASAVLGTEEFLVRGLPALGRLAFAGISRLGRLSLSLLREGGSLLIKTLRLVPHTYTGLRFAGVLAAGYLAQQDLLTGRTSDFVVTASLAGTLAALDSPQRLLSFLGKRYGRAWTAALLAGLYDRRRDPDGALNKRLGVMALAASAVLGTEELLAWMARHPITVGRFGLASFATYQAYKDWRRQNYGGMLVSLSLGSAALFLDSPRKLRIALRSRLGRAWLAATLVAGAERYREEGITWKSGAAAAVAAFGPELVLRKPLTTLRLGAAAFAAYRANQTTPYEAVFYGSLSVMLLSNRLPWRSRLGRAWLGATVVGLLDRREDGLGFAQSVLAGLAIGYGPDLLLKTGRWAVRRPVLAGRFLVSNLALVKTTLAAKEGETYKAATYASLAAAVTFIDSPQRLQSALRSRLGRAWLVATAYGLYDSEPSWRAASLAAAAAFAPDLVSYTFSGKARPSRVLAPLILIGAGLTQKEEDSPRRMLGYSLLAGSVLLGGEFDRILPWLQRTGSIAAKISSGVQQITHWAVGTHLGRSLGLGAAAALVALNWQNLSPEMRVQAVAALGAGVALEALTYRSLRNWAAALYGPSVGSQFVARGAFSSISDIASGSLDLYITWRGLKRMAEAKHTLEYQVGAMESAGAAASLFASAGSMGAGGGAGGSLAANVISQTLAPYLARRRAILRYQYRKPDTLFVAEDTLYTARVAAVSQHLGEVITAGLRSANAFRFGGTVAGLLAVSAALRLDPDANTQFITLGPLELNPIDVTVAAAVGGKAVHHISRWAATRQVAEGALPWYAKAANRVVNWIAEIPKGGAAGFEEAVGKAAERLTSLRASPANKVLAIAGTRQRAVELLESVGAGNLAQHLDDPTDEVVQALARARGREVLTRGGGAIQAVGKGLGRVLQVLGPVIDLSSAIAGQRETGQARNLFGGQAQAFRRGLHRRLSGSAAASGSFAGWALGNPLLAAGLSFVAGALGSSAAEDIYARAVRYRVFPEEVHKGMNVGGMVGLGVGLVSVATVATAVLTGAISLPVLGLVGLVGLAAAGVTAFWSVGQYVGARLAIEEARKPSSRQQRPERRRRERLLSRQSQETTRQLPGSDSAVNQEVRQFQSRLQQHRELMEHYLEDNKPESLNPRERRSLTAAQVSQKQQEAEQQVKRLGQSYSYILEPIKAILGSLRPQPKKEQEQRVQVQPQRKDSWVQRLWNAVKRFLGRLVGGPAQAAELPKPARQTETPLVLTPSTPGARIEGVDPRIRRTALGGLSRNLDAVLMAIRAVEASGDYNVRSTSHAHTGWRVDQGPYQEGYFEHYLAVGAKRLGVDPSKLTREQKYDVAAVGRLHEKGLIERIESADLSDPNQRLAIAKSVAKAWGSAFAHRPEYQRHYAHLIGEAHRAQDILAKEQSRVDNGKFVSAIRGRTLEEMVRYRPSESQGFYARRARGRQHSKVDFDARVGAGQGAVIQAMEGGRATYVPWTSTSGMVRVETKDSRGRTITYEYGHLSLESIRRVFGNRRTIEVQAGQQLGTVTMDALSSGPHLDLGIKVDGKYVDPQQYIRERMTLEAAQQAVQPKVQEDPSLKTEVEAAKQVADKVVEAAQEKIDQAIANRPRRVRVHKAQSPVPTARADSAAVPVKNGRSPEIEWTGPLQGVMRHAVHDDDRVVTKANDTARVADPAARYETALR